MSICFYLFTAIRKVIRFYIKIKFIVSEQKTPLNKRSGGYFYRSIVKLTTDTLCNVDNELGNRGSFKCHITH